MLKKRFMATWIFLGLSFVAITGCSPGGGPLSGKQYDLADYLFPERSGILVYRRFTSEKPEDVKHFSEPEYQKDVQHKVVRNRNAIKVQIGDEVNRTYTLSDKTIDVEESKNDLSYRFQRHASAHTNFVKESVIKESEEIGSSSRITYECNITGFKSTMTVKSNPQTYDDVLHIVCVRKQSVSTILDGKKITSLTERREENDYAKNVGLIRAEETWCDEVVIDDEHRSEAGCTRILDRIVTFIGE